MTENHVILNLKIDHPDCGHVDMAVYANGTARLSKQDHSMDLELPNVIFDLCIANVERAMEEKRPNWVSHDEHSIITAFVASRWSPISS
jgi:hypothetical protein